VADADMLYGDERKVWGDGGYQGQSETIRQAAPHAGYDQPPDQIQRLC
jgi:IS5 family transposase